MCYTVIFAADCYFWIVSFPNAFFLCCSSLCSSLFCRFIYLFFQPRGVRGGGKQNFCSKFQEFVDAYVKVRALVTSFYNSDYATCFSILDAIKGELLLDYLLFPLVDNLYREIRIRSINQYFQPYKSVKLSSMAEAFSTTPEALEDELAKIIADDHLPARIDSDQKVLCAIDTNLRHKALERGIQVMEKFQTSTQTLLFHAAVSRAKLALQAAATEDQ
eukprot:m.120604 g.120604  ORF g.120604 m.120604 type:complete len:218 (+) comp15499_c0_seq4:1071-1724(+)